MAVEASILPNCSVTRWTEIVLQTLEMILNTESVLFFLGEQFRMSMLGDYDGEENDEDSVINDLEFYLGNYEADWAGQGPATILEQWGWEHLSQVIWVRRNSARAREAWVEEPGERNLIE